MLGMDRPLCFCNPSLPLVVFLNHHVLSTCMVHIPLPFSFKRYKNKMSTQSYPFEASLLYPQLSKCRTNKISFPSSTSSAHNYPNAGKDLLRNALEDSSGWRALRSGGQNQLVIQHQLCGTPFPILKKKKNCRVSVFLCTITH